jgi:D-alanyl-D-alanine carboxypeptidase (penicillin-binding protein 5/6)
VRREATRREATRRGTARRDTASRRTWIVAAICGLLVLTCGLGGVTLGAGLAVPARAGSTRQVDFQVGAGERAASVTARLQREGLIANAGAFALDAGARHLDAALRPGVYRLSPAMSADAIAARLASGHPDAQWVMLPPGLRAAQYPAYLASLLPSFRAATFEQIATSGQLPGGAALAARYWFVAPKGPYVHVALEGYLTPGTYLLDTRNDAAAVVERLLDALGEQLCPGPDATHLDAYLRDQAQCRAHAATIAAGGQRVGVFAALEARFATTDDRAALYDALTLGSLVAREAATSDDAPGVAQVFYNRYLAWKSNAADPAGDAVQYLDADSSAQYARDSAQPPAGGAWWAPLAAPADQTAPGDPYNTTVPANTGLMPGPIAAPSWAELAAVAAADPSGTPAVYYVRAVCGATYLAGSAAEFQGVLVKARYEAATGCRQVAPPPMLSSDLPTARPGADPQPIPPPPGDGAAAMILMNPDTGDVYLAHDADAERAMASTTKIMTAIVAITYGSLDQRIVVGPDLAQLQGTGASVAGLQVGERFTLNDLLYALMLPSGDDAALVIADGVVGNEPGFVFLMNDEARQLGLTHTHFANAHGLDADAHYSSAADLARLATYALHVPALAAVMATATYTLPATADHQAYTWQTTNELLDPPAYPGTLGVKTGFTGNAGYCLVFAAAGPTGRLVGVVLGEATYEGRFTDARALLDWGFVFEAHVDRVRPLGPSTSG